MSNIQLHSLWDQKLDQIRSIFAPKLTNDEFMAFVQLGKSKGLDPFNREIWAVKFSGPAQIFIGRDGYRKIAQSHPDYIGHISDVIYENDDFIADCGVPKHKYSLKNRGAIMGAYCCVHKKGMIQPILNIVSFSEYSSGTNPLWKNKPETMIKKVAEAQGLRSAFSDMFNGTYDESEQWETTSVDVVKSDIEAQLEKEWNEYYDIRKENNPVDWNEQHRNTRLETLKKQKFQTTFIDDDQMAQLIEIIKEKKLELNKE